MPTMAVTVKQTRKEAGKAGSYLYDVEHRGKLREDDCLLVRIHSPVAPQVLEKGAALERSLVPWEGGEGEGRGGLGGFGLGMLGGGGCQGTLGFRV